MHAKQSTPTVAILLSTYNGQRFIAEQLDSILAQDYTDITIRVRDDGSTDGTIDVVQAYAKRDPRITFTLGSNLGCVGSFFNLLCMADADIVMLCDQDDIWLPKKVTNAVTTLVAAGLQRPILYHTDLVVVDERCVTLAGSFMAQQGLLMPQAHSLEVLAIQNCVVGCTVAMTAEFVHCARLSGEIVSAAAMHDWWLAILACCKGTLIYSPQAEILYRQHGANVSGATRNPLLERIKAQFSSVGLARINAYRRKVSRQAREFLTHYDSELSSKQKEVLTKVVYLDPEHGFMPVFRSQISGIRFQNAYMNLSLLYTATLTWISNMFGSRPD